MDPIHLALGQHRNEKSALELGTFAAFELTKRGHIVTILENPEMRTLLEIVLDADAHGKTISQDEIEQILYGWDNHHGDSERRPHAPYVFCIHGYDYLDTPQEQFDGVWENFSQFGTHPDRELAKLVKYDPFGSGGGTVELPEIWDQELPGEYHEVIRRVMPHRYGEGYLLQTNMEATRQRGWASKALLDVLVNGIDHIVRHEILYR